jgi:DNA mismatch repair protein MutS
VILDEIGRGTSTFDGLSIAWAVAEHLAQAVRCRTLFATHYHEMTALAADPHIANHSVSARELDGDIVFLHRLVQGPASQSYGVAVAKLAGLPRSVLARADELLTGFESGEPKAAGRQRSRAPKAPPNQLSLFQPASVSSIEKIVLEKLRSVEVERMSPLDALALVADLKTRLSS